MGAERPATSRLNVAANIGRISADIVVEEVVHILFWQSTKLEALQEPVTRLKEYASIV